MKMLIDKLVKDWAWRVNDGMPDPSKKDHLELLEQTLRSHKYSEEFISKFLSQISEKKGKVYVKGKPPKGAKVQVGPRGGRYYYGDTETGEPAKEPEPTKKEKPAPTKKADDKKDSSEPKEQSKNQSKLNVFIDKIKDPEQKENALKVKDAVGKLDDKNTTQEEKAAIIATLVADGLIERNASGSKMYMASKTGMPHKALGDPATKNLRDSMAALGLENIPLRGKQLTLSGKKLVPNKIFATDGKLPTTDVKIEKTKEGVKIDGIEYKRQPEISIEKLTEIYGDEKQAKKAERSIAKHNELIDRVEQVLVEGGNLNVVSPLPDTPPTTPENRRKLRDHTTDKIAETIEENFPENKRSPVAKEVLEEIKALKDIDDSEEYDKKIMEITDKIFEDETLSTGAADLVETISYTRALNKGKAVYLPSASNFPLGDVLSISTEKIDVEKDSPEDISKKVEAITFGIENRSIKKGAGGASASNGKVKLTNFKETNGIKPEEIKSDLDNLSSTSYDEIFDGDDIEKAHSNVKEKAKKYGIDLEDEKYVTRRTKSVSTAVLAVVSKNPEVDQDSLRKKLTAYHDLGHTFALAYNKTVAQQLFTNEVWKYSKKEKKVIVDRTDGINRISECQFAFSVGWGKTGRPTNKVPTRFKNVDVEEQNEN